MTTPEERDTAVHEEEERPIDAIDLLPVNGVLGLGEPTHGSGNVFAWKWQVILDLARRGLISTVAFEESYAVGRAVDAVLRPGTDGLTTGAASAAPVASALDEAWGRGSSIWDTREIRAGLHALRELNLELPPKSRIRFLGIDVRKPHEAARQLLDRGHEEPVLIDLAERRELGIDGPGRLLAATRRIARTAGSPCSEHAAAANASVDGALARQIARYVETYLQRPGLEGLHLREPHMASTVVENLPSVGGTVVWAHNEHVSRAEDALGEAARTGAGPAAATPSMGWYLAEQLGPRYVPVGVLCTTGECRAVDPASGDEGYSSVRLPPIRPRTTEHALADVPRGLHRTRDLLPHPGPRRFIGWQVDSDLATSDPAAFEIMRPTSDFAAIQLMGPSAAAQ